MRIVNIESGNLQRYSRQMAFSRLGAKGQEQLRRSTAILIGCGALGSVIANTLVRAGVGTLRIVDRDFVELSNLQRQLLFDENDVRDGTPKAVAATRRLQQINSEVNVIPSVQDVTSGNIESLCEGADVILDGSDNFELRFLINDVSVKLGIPWVYGGCLGADGQTMTILPGKTACLRCLMADGPPPPGTTETCDTAGILAPVISVIASIQAIEAMKILSGNAKDASRNLQVVSMWSNDYRQMDLSQLREQSDCRTCVHHDFPWLSGHNESQSTVLCGRDAVQLRTQTSNELNLSQVAERLEGLGELHANDYLIRFRVDSYQLTLFTDGRAIIHGTDDPAIARKIYAQYVGQ